MSRHCINYTKLDFGLEINYGARHSLQLFSIVNPFSPGQFISFVNSLYIFHTK